jgi:acetolactate synthase small subunit
MSSHSPNVLNAIAQDESATACFALRLLPEPGALPRVLELFAKRGMVPSSLHAGLNGSGEEARLIVDLQLDGLAEPQAELIAEALRQIVIVERVLTARKRLSAQAA